ncbi:NAD-dependent epimerase/dehydratase family protein [Desulfolutivibrio sulfoxidireducens]|uniref:NAD-dependent epimerase/dehydratase family protein n=1 Tax=Desulfolutivibrio sulfoxidireducens TaxID=2773299 RepID=UPI00159E2648|nr:NAD(P)-dependent oxidoreductase [Desulfolutivibrio sulfoxidireducens]QLA18865.1 SDR family NAD(P)-dependent oxidoreductase [Desulfolutivibrio sulfoxidireducens]
MNVLVTGGSGFLGSHVADALSDAGHVVTVFDITPSPYLRSDQIMITGDIMDMPAVAATVRDMDVVYHFAGIADIDECKANPLKTAHVNILGTVQLLEACRNSGIKRFVFASSAYVYSDAGSFYRSSKQACESFIENYADLYGLKYTCLRYGSLYGPRADKRNGVYRLLWQAIVDRKISYRGSGEDLREFIHVRDAARSSVKILEMEFENSHIILTGNEKMRYADLLEMIKEIMGNKIEIEIVSSTRKAHYRITPYNFNPKVGMKLVNNPHIDMGQGLLQCLAELYENVGEGKSSEFRICPQ